MVKCRNCKNNVLHEEDGEQYSWCVIDHDNYDIDEPRECASFKTATNADKLRSMSDEELAEWLSPIADCVRCYTWDKDNLFDMRPCYTGEKRCKQVWLDWLQEVSE